MSAQVTITQLPSAGALTGTENVPVVQNGVTVQTTTGAIAGAGALNYPFLTTGSTAGLTQARALTAGTGLSLTDGGVGTTLQVNMTGAAAALNAASTGLLVKTGTNTVANVALSVGSGMTIVNANGVAGNPTISLSTNLQNLSSLSGTGLMTINGKTFSQTTITGTSNQIDVVNGNSAPVLSLASNAILPGTGGMTVPSGTTAQRAGSNGAIRYNTSTNFFEGFMSGSWLAFAAGAGSGTVTSVSFTGGIVSVATATTTPALTVAGTSGGIPYFSSGTTWATSAALAASAIVIGGGAGVAPSTTTTGTGVLTAVGNAVNTTGGLVTVDGSATLTNKTLTNPTVTNYTETPFTANTSTAITLALTNGTVQILTLTGSPTITMPTAVSGKSFIIMLKTGSGSFTVTWSTVKWPSGTAPTITSTASRQDVFSFFSDGTNWYGSTLGQNYTP